jgi:quercetin dioxygenase-like cupin family protein
MSDEQVAPETRGVAVELLAIVDLGAEIEGMEGRQLRMRMVTIEPGGVFGPVHDHKGRPGTVYVLQGTITDHRDGIATDYGPGVGWPEDRKTVHWLENRGQFRRWRSRSTSSGTSRRAAAEPAVHVMAWRRPIEVHLGHTDLTIPNFAEPQKPPPA